MKSLLRHRKINKTKKPSFSHQDSHKRKGISKRWRRPKGLQSKMRLKKRGYPKGPEIGYRSPKAIRNTTHEGLMPALVSSHNDMKNLDVKNGIIIRSSVGTRKRIAIIQSAMDKGIRITNIREPSVFVKKAIERLSKKKKEKKKTETKEMEGKKAETKTLEQTVRADDKKKKEKKERDKIITKRV